jgi:hypothetical protein
VTKTGPCGAARWPGCAKRNGGHLQANRRSRNRQPASCARGCHFAAAGHAQALPSLVPPDVPPASGRIPAHPHTRDSANSTLILDDVIRRRPICSEPLHTLQVRNVRRLSPRRSASPSRPPGRAVQLEHAPAALSPHSPRLSLDACAAASSHPLPPSATRRCRGPLATRGSRPSASGTTTAAQTGARRHWGPINAETSHPPRRHGLGHGGLL